MRYTRQELKQDKFAETAAEAAHWTVEHRSTITAVASVIVAAILIGAGFWWYMQSQNQAASTELGKALAVYSAPVVPPGTPKQGEQIMFYSPQERAIAAKNAFYAISSKYGMTHSGRYAHYLAAVCETELDNYKVAEDQLKQVSDVHDAPVASLAKLTLAGVYLNEGRENDAVALYKDRIEHPSTTVPKTRAQLALAEVYASKQPSAAAAIYDQMIKEDPKGVGAEVAEAAKKNLKQ
ncbi:MAG TPA: tetratricopeptide repeat protein [Terriglobales bacterium]